MSENGQLPEVNVGSQGMGDGSDVGSTTMAASRKEELELMAMALKRVLEPILEPFIRRVVKEELMQQGVLPSLNQNTGNETDRSEPRNLELRFRNKLPKQFWTGNHIKGEDGTSSVEIVVVDVDVATGNVVNVWLEVEIVLLRVDSGDEGHDWTTEEFNEKIVKEWKGKPFLKGNTFLNLKEGVGSIDEISFTHSKNSVPITKFRLGARTKGDFKGTRVREAKSEIFVLEDRRNQGNKKHYRLSLDDEVWRLKKISRDGDLHKRLSSEKVEKVEDFLKLHFTDPTRLRNILGNGISDKVLNKIVEHGLTCKLDKKYLCYSLASQPITGVVFNEVRQAVGILIERQYVPTERLLEKEKDDAQKLVVSAFANCREVFPYDESYLSPDSSHLVNTVAPPSILPRPESPINAPSVGNDHFQSIPSLFGTIPTDNLTGTSNALIAGYDNLQPSTSSQGINPPNDFSFSPTGSMDEVRLSYLLSTLDDSCPLSVDDYNFQAINHSENSLDANSHTAEIRVGVQAASVDQTKRRRWLKWSMALSFSRRVKMTIKESDHIRKKQRLH